MNLRSRKCESIRNDLLGVDVSTCVKVTICVLESGGDDSPGILVPPSHTYGSAVPRCTRDACTTEVPKDDDTRLLITHGGEEVLCIPVVQLNPLSVFTGLISLIIEITEK